MIMYCNVCNVDIEKSNWDNHVNSETHKRNLFNELPDYSPGEGFKNAEGNRNFSIVEQKSKYNQHYKAWMIDYKVNISPNVNIENLNDILLELMNTVKQRTLFRDGDKIDLIISNPNLYHTISTGLMTI